MQASLAKKSKLSAPSSQQPPATNVQLFKPTTSSIVAPIVPPIALSQPATSSNELHSIAETVLKKRQGEVLTGNTSPKRAPLRLRPTNVADSLSSNTVAAPISLLPATISTQAALDMDDNLDDVEIDDEECFNKTSSESSSDMENIILGLYKKVWKPKYKNLSRDKEKQKDMDTYRNKMKFQLVNVVMFIDGVDYVLKSLEGELDTLN